MSSPFEGVLGNNSELKILDYLLPLEGIKFNITELAKEVGVSRVTATRVVKKFVEWNVLNLTRTAGNITYYSINHESPIVKSIEQFNNALIENILCDETLYEIHDYWETQRPHTLAKTAVTETFSHSRSPQQVGEFPPWSIGILTDLQPQFPRQKETAPPQTSGINAFDDISYGSTRPQAHYFGEI